MYHHNICSLKNKVNALDVELHILNYPLVACFTETHLNEANRLSVKPFNYVHATDFCRTAQKCGGSSIFVYNGIRYGVIDVAQFGVEHSFECCAVHIKEPYDIVVCCIYMSNVSYIETFLLQLHKLLEWLFKKYNCKVFVVGDFNVDFLTNSTNKQKVCSNFRSFGMRPVFSQVTRIDSVHKTGSCIDQCFTNSPLTKIEAEVLISEYSDHHSQLLTFQCPIKGQKK